MNLPFEVENFSHALYNLKTNYEKNITSSIDLVTGKPISGLTEDTMSVLKVHEEEYLETLKTVALYAQELQNNTTVDFLDLETEMSNAKNTTKKMIELRSETLASSI
jgi:hypothetical protein